MKKIQLTFIAILFFAISTFAQAKAVGKAVIKVPALTCEVCKDRIEQNLFKAYGIASIKADFKKQTVTVTWLTDRTNLLEIKLMLNNAGFDADDEAAEPSAAKRLPPCCKALPAKPVVAASVEVLPVVVPQKILVDTIKKVVPVKKGKIAEKKK
jgi:periplasmic mercuric ion binding protein